jgi:hypothetical protein
MIYNEMFGQAKAKLKRTPHLAEMCLPGTLTHHRTLRDTDRELCYLSGRAMGT